MSKPDIWMPLYIADYLADTQHLTRDEHGGYILLLMAYWRNGGRLQDDDKRLAAIVKATPREWKSLRGIMAEFFTIEDGFWIHGRADKELKDASYNAAKNASRAKAAAEKRWNKPSSSNAPSIPPSNARGDACDVLEQCPSPSPTPTPKNKTVAPESGGNTPPPPNPQTPPDADASPAQNRTQIDPEFQPDEPNTRTALGLNLDTAAERERFVAHYTATGEWRANWQAQFRKWVLDSMQHRAVADRRAQSPPHGKQAARERYAEDARAAEQRIDNPNSEQSHARPERDITGIATVVA